MKYELQEYVQSTGVSMRVDRQRGIIRGVKILGIRSRNGRVYLPEALRRAAVLYENAKVNVNHPKHRPDEVRDYRDRLGVIRNVEFRDNEGLFADLHFNPKHPVAEQLAWDAENLPENVGFSHNVLARVTNNGKEQIVEEILEVRSVDLVADPATTRGLFEAENNALLTDDKAVVCWHAIKLEQLRQKRPDIVDEIVRPLQEEINRLKAELDELGSAHQLLQRKVLVDRLLEQYGLPKPSAGEESPLVTQQFYEQLLAAGDEQKVLRLIEERRRLLEALHGNLAGPTPMFSLPLSRPQFPPAGENSLQAFVAAISRTM